MNLGVKIIAFKVPFRQEETFDCLICFTSKSVQSLMVFTQQDQVIQYKKSIHLYSVIAFVQHIICIIWSTEDSSLKALAEHMLWIYIQFLYTGSIYTKDKFLVIIKETENTLMLVESLEEIKYRNEVLGYNSYLLAHFSPSSQCENTSDFYSFHKRNIYYTEHEHRFNHSCLPLFLDPSEMLIDSAHCLLFMYLLVISQCLLKYFSICQEGTRLPREEIFLALISSL